MPRGRPPKQAKLKKDLLFDPSKYRNIINFTRSKYKTVSFNVHTDIPLLKEGMFIRFFYGPGRDHEHQYHRKVDGKIKQIVKNGLHVLTDTGWMFPSFERIFKLYTEKTSRKIKVSEIKSNDTLNSALSNNVVGLFDGALNKLLDRVSKKVPNVKVKDKRIDKKDEFYRKITFAKGKHRIHFEIENNKAKFIKITGYGFKREGGGKIKANGNKITSQQIGNSIKKIEMLDAKF